jgi:TonB family protein
MKRSALLGAVVCSLFAIAAGAGESEGTHGTFAKPVKRDAPSYPLRLLNKGQQGWVQLSFVVTAEGEVVDPVVTESSSGDFDEAALDVVRGWSYEPATWRGKPVQQCDNKVLVSFALVEDANAISRSFYKRYRKINRAFDANDLSSASTLIDGLADDVKTAPELALLDVLRARRADREGNTADRLKYLRRATIGNGKYLDPDIYESLRTALLVLQFQENEYSAALASWEEVQKFKLPDGDREAFEGAVAKLRAFVEGPAVLSVPGELEADEGCTDCEAEWHHHLLRDRFQFSSLTGDVDRAELRCDWHRYVDAVTPDTVWRVPADWGKCDLFVFGTDGTRFEVLELPAEST